jgi:hypothetical protein
MKPFRYVSLVLVVFLTLPLMAQDPGFRHMKIYAGIGVPEFAGLAAGVENGPVEIRVGAGILPLPDEQLWSVYGDLSYHFAGSSVHTPARPWYARPGILYMEETSSKWEDRYVYLSLRVGRCFNINPRWGIEVDAGIGKELSYERINLTPDGSNSWIHFDITPAAGVRVVYRFIP